MKNSQEIRSELVEKLLVIEERNAGWKLELNVVSWNGEDPKYDIRPWNADHSKCGKGITLTEDNLKALVTYCNDNMLQAI